MLGSVPLPALGCWPSGEGMSENKALIQLTVPPTLREREREGGGEAEGERKRGGMRETDREVGEGERKEKGGGKER